MMKTLQIAVFCLTLQYKLKKSQIYNNKFLCLHIQTSAKNQSFAISSVQLFLLMRYFTARAMCVPFAAASLATSLVDFSSQHDQIIFSF